MLDIKTKRVVDSARNILVAKIPAPNTQVEQITIAMLYKFMDDMDQESIEMGWNPKFFIGEYSKYSWRKIIRKSLSAQERFYLYTEALEKFYSHPSLPQAFKDIFKNTTVPYKDPEILTMFLNEIDMGFNYGDSEQLGDAYEYLLSILGSQGDLGQFRTPRHIIDFIVKVVDPKKNDKILDPACGTAGFLISAYKYIMENNKSKKAGDKLNLDEKNIILNNITGYDVEPSMIKIAEMNMFLHGADNPDIYEYDTLIREDKWEEKFDVILANPPFMSPKGGIKPHQKFKINANRSELLFVDYIAEHLKKDGRAGVIVPEGVVYQDGKIYQKLREELVDGDILYAVVSLPQGVFNPYAGVKTCILFFDKLLAKKTTDILFIKINNEGYSLGAQRKEISSNDLPTALSIITKYKNSIINEIVFDLKSEEKSMINIVPKNKIKAEKYNLVFDRYNSDANNSNSKYNMIKLSEVCDIYNGSTPSRANEEYWNNGTINWFTVEDIRKQGRIIKETQQLITKKALKETSVKLLPPKTLLLCCTASVGEYAISEVELTTNQQFNGLVIKKEYKDKLDPYYLFYIASKLKNDLNRLSGTTSFQFVSVKNLKEIEIPLPPIGIQKELIKKLDVIDHKIKEAENIILNSKIEIEEYINEIWG